MALLSDDLSTRLISAEKGGATFPSLTASTGGSLLSEQLRRRMEERPGDPLASERARVIHERLSGGSEAGKSEDWWLQRMKMAAGTCSEAEWLRLGSGLGIKRLSTELSDQLALRDGSAIRAALAVGASPSDGSPQDAKLTYAVLDGRCSDVVALGRSEATNLLRAMRPHWFLELALRGQDQPCSIRGTDHYAPADRDRPIRTDSFKTLVELDSRYERVRRAADSRGMGQKGTTEPWQNPAQQLADMHGACWLAADIALIGAANRNASPQGSFIEGAPVLGERPDYGTFVMEIRRGRAPWGGWIAEYQDELSARTIAFGMVATCEDAGAIIDFLGRTVDSMTDEQFEALAGSSSRLGQSALARRLPFDALLAAKTSSPRVQLLLSHYVASLTRHDPLKGLPDKDLLALASYGAASWPAARAIIARMWTRPNDTLDEGLRRLDPLSRVPCPDGRRRVDQSSVDRALTSPASYPAAWVIAAERARSGANSDEAMGVIARRNDWAPRITR